MKLLLANFTKMVNDSGGVAKVACAFANEFVNRGYEVYLMHSDDKEGNFFFPIDEKVACFNINKRPDGSILKMPLALKGIREVARLFGKKAATDVNRYFDKKYLMQNVNYYYDKIQPDIVIAFHPAESQIILEELGKKVQVITMAHGDPSDYFTDYPKKEIAALPKSAVCQVLMKSYEKPLLDNFKSIKVVTIGNAIPQYEKAADLGKQKEKYKIIFVGRLNKHRKRPHLIIEAFANLVNKHKNWIVELWGSPDNEAYLKELQSMIKSKKLDDKVFIMGSTKDVAGVLETADIFAFPSNYEGFPLALGEGMSMGLPSVGYVDCPSVNELIVDDKNGVLFDDKDNTLEKCLDKLMSDQELRVRLGKQAKMDMKEFSPKIICDKWEDLIKEVKKGNDK